MRPGRGGHSTEFRAAVLRVWGEGVLSTRDIAEAFEISARTVWKWTRGLPLRKVGRIPVTVLAALLKRS